MIDQRGKLFVLLQILHINKIMIILLNILEFL